MPSESTAARVRRTKKIIATLKRTHPDAKLALDFSNPLELLVALILAAQCRDKLVNEVTAGLFRKYRNVRNWTRLRQDDIRRINFYRNKTRSIQGACRVLMEKFDGKVPGNLDDLLTLPGVGRKTANIILGNAFGQPAIGVDTHVWRLSQRLGLSRKDTPDEIEADLAPIVPAKDQIKFCHLLQFHSRRVCAARNPNCPNCSVSRLCPWPQKTK